MKALTDGNTLSDLPSGTVTFLFTDIEGSTKLLELLGEQYARLLADHRVILRAAFEKHNGREIGTQGDSFFTSFPRATDAVAAVVEILQSLANHQWPGDVDVRLRMGLHTGEPWLVEEDYVGMDVHRAARIGHVGHGGQVLLSETTTPLITGDLPAYIRLQDLGSHRLKDMRRPEHIHQLVIEGLPCEFPPLKSLEIIDPIPIMAEALQVREIREVGDSPYRGLAAFREVDAPLFFGREEFTQQLFEAVQERGLVAVIVGPSGSGKSSTVFAGLMPQLRQDKKWLIVETRPGVRPFYSLAGALYPILNKAHDETDHLVGANKLAQAIQSGELSLFQVVIRALERSPEVQRMLLVIDQFEELFTLQPDPEAQRLFLDELLTAVQAGAASRRSPLVLLLTLRADFMGQALTHRPFADALQDGSIILGPMNREELQAAVENPAELRGAAFETALVQRILDDVGQEPGNLPLLEFALTLLWERLDGGWMTHAAYDEIGRVDGALARYAEEVYAELDEAEKEGARHLFVQLVQPGEGTEDTRRVARRGELDQKIWPLIRHLADKRLVVTGLNEVGDETVEVVHEAMIRGWHRLRSWMKEDRSFRTWQEGLRANLHQWEATGQDKGALLRGVPLARAEEWLLGRQEDLSPAEISFIELSMERSRKTQARRDRRRTLIIAGLAVGMLLASILSAFALSQRSEAVAESEARATQQIIAETEADARATQQVIAESERVRAEAESDARATQQAIAEGERARAEEAVDEIASQQALTEAMARQALSRSLAASAISNLNIDPQLGLLLAIEAANQTYSSGGTILPEVQTALHQTVQDVSRLELTIPPQGNELPYILFSLDGGQLISHYLPSGVDPRSYPDGTTTVIWDASDGTLLHTLPKGIVVNALPVGTDVGIVEIIDNELILNLWNTSDGTARLPIVLEIPGTFNSEDLVALALNRDVTILTSVWLGGRDIKAWELDTASEIATPADVLGGGTGRPWPIAPLEGAGTIQIGGVPSIISISTNGAQMFALYMTGDMYTLFDPLLVARDIWTGDTVPLILFPELEFPNPILSLSPDERLLAVASLNYLEIQHFETFQYLNRFVNSSGSNFSALAFSPDSTMLAGASEDGIIKIWNVETLAVDGISKHMITLAIPGPIIHDIEFSPDGRRLATASGDGTIKLWDIRPGGGVELPLLGQDLLEDELGAISIAMSPDGVRMAIAGQSGFAAVYDVEDGDRVFQLGDTQSGPLVQIEYSPDGSTIATCRFAGPFQIWDGGNGDELLLLDGYTEGTCSFDHHPDGKSVTLGFFKNGAGWYQHLDLPELDQGNLVEVDPAPSSEWGSAHDGETTSLAINDMETMLAYTSGNGELFIWSDKAFDKIEGSVLGYVSGETIYSENLLVHEGQNYLEVLFVPAEKYLVATGLGGSVSIWDAAKAQIVRTIAAHEGRITAVAISHDGRWLATSGADRAIRLWDMNTGDSLLSLTDQTLMITDLEFSPDGKRLYAAGEDGAVRQYIMDADELMALAESRVSRSLTDEECWQYLHLEVCPQR
jgi:WD40 repeat protein/class 3 adenylate cyclase